MNKNKTGTIHRRHLSSLDKFGGFRRPPVSIYSWIPGTIYKFPTRTAKKFICDGNIIKLKVFERLVDEERSDTRI